MHHDESGPPQIKLNRSQWLRLVIVGIFTVIAVSRVVPDFVRIFMPIGVFGYATDLNGDVIKAPPARRSDLSKLHIGDRILVSQIKPFDRKPGIIGTSVFTESNFDRKITVESHGKTRIVQLKARVEPLPGRIITAVRIVIYLLSVGLGAMLVIVKPNIATAGFFAFALGGDYPTTYAETVFDVPWREMVSWVSDVIVGAARPALLLFALCLVVERTDRQRLFAAACAAGALFLGLLNAYTNWLANYVGTPAQPFEHIYLDASSAITALTTLVLVAAFVRSKGNERSRIGWIVISFALAGVARIASDRYYPKDVNFWENAILLTIAVVPIFVVWIGVLRSRFFDVDFVVSRAIIYVSLTAAVLGVITVSEEVLSYVFYNNTNLATGLVVIISMGFASLTGKAKDFLDTVVDRYIFRDRRTQRKALERMSLRIIDARNAEEVYHALFHDATEALKLSFGGIVVRQEDGSFELTHQHSWPGHYDVRFGPEHPLTRAVAKSRHVLSEGTKENKLIRRAFADEGVAFAAPLFVDRAVTAIVLYGHNTSGLTLDPDEQQLLTRLAAHASIALNAIELERYRDHAVSMVQQYVEGDAPVPYL